MWNAGALRRTGCPNQPRSGVLTPERIVNIQLKQQARKLIQSKGVAVDKSGDKAVTHIAAALFFAAVLLGAGAIIRATLRDYWQDIMAALRGDVPVRRSNRPWASRARVIARPRTVASARAVPQQRVAF